MRHTHGQHADGQSARPISVSTDSQEESLDSADDPTPARTAAEETSGDAGVDQRKIRLMNLTRSIAERNQMVKQIEVSKIVSRPKNRFKQKRIISDRSPETSEAGEEDGEEDMVESEPSPMGRPLKKKQRLSLTQPVPQLKDRNHQLLFHFDVEDSISKRGTSSGLYTSTSTEDERLDSSATSLERGPRQSKPKTNTRKTLGDKIEDTTDRTWRGGTLKRKEHTIRSRKRVDDSFIVSNSEEETGEDADDYSSHLQLYNALNMEEDAYPFITVSEKDSIKIYIEYIALSLLSPTLTYKSSLFKPSGNISTVAKSLSAHYTQLTQMFTRTSVADGCMEQMEAAQKTKAAEKTKGRRKLKRSCRVEGADSSDESIQKPVPTGATLKGIENKRHKKILDSELESEFDSPHKDKEADQTVMVECVTIDRRADAKSDGGAEEGILRDGESSEGEMGFSTDSMYRLDGENNCSDIEYGSGHSKSSIGSRDQVSTPKLVRREFKQNINDELIHQLLTPDMIGHFKYLKEKEKYDSYEFLKMIHKISKQKSEYFYEKSINKIEKWILSKRDQFESHPFKKEFKNILQNYANVHEYGEDTYECPIYVCGCCARRIKCCSFLFLYAPFYNSAELWSNRFFNFLAVHDFEWLGRIHFKGAGNPLAQAKRRSQDASKMEGLKKEITAYMEAQYGDIESAEVDVPEKDLTLVDKQKRLLHEFIQYSEHKEGDVEKDATTGDEDKDTTATKPFYFSKDYEFKSKFLLTFQRIFERYDLLYQRYVDRNILLLHLGSHCESAVRYWHLFHSFKYFITKRIYITLLRLFRNNEQLFEEPLVVAYVVTRKLYKSVYARFRNLMKINIGDVLRQNRTDPYFINKLY